MADLQTYLDITVMAPDGALPVSGAQAWAQPVDILPFFRGDAAAFADLTATPTTLAGYGITDAASPDLVSDIAWLTPPAGEYMMTTLAANAALGTIAPGTNTLRLFPFTARADTPISGLALNVVTGGVGAPMAKMVVYTSDAAGRPDAVLFETAEVECFTLGVKTAPAALTLQRGKTYWFGVRFNGAPTISAWAASATPDINGGSPVTTIRKSLSRTVGYATPAPSPWGWSSAEIIGGSGPAIWLQV